MNKLYFLSFFLLPLLSFSQNVNIPDSNFKNALVNTNCVDTDNNGIYDSDVDINNDGEIQVSEAISVTNLYLDFQNISSLQGLSFFTNVVLLSCSDNPFAELDTSALVNLEEIRCVDIDQVISLDFSSNINLTSLECDQNGSLEFLNIQNGNNVNLEKLWSQDSPNLQCIQVDDVNFASNQNCETYSGWCIDSSTIFSQDCSSLGISENEIMSTKIFPNPFKNKVEIRSSMVFDRYEIRSIDGKKIERNSLDKTYINLSELSSGVYFLKLENQNRTLIKKIVKE